MSQKRAKEPCSCSAHHTMLAAGGGEGAGYFSQALQSVFPPLGGMGKGSRTLQTG